MKTNRLTKLITGLLALCLAIVFMIKFAGPNILRQYISSGIGGCKNIPILCMQPEEKFFSPVIDPEYLATLVPQKFPKMSIAIPKGFSLIQELIKKVYYKKRPNHNQAVIYLLRQEPLAFIKLYPDVQKQGVRDNKEFIDRLMRANLESVNNITDAFFVIMKSVFTPDIGNQSTAKMIKFKIQDKSGYINYTLTKPRILPFVSQILPRLQPENAWQLNNYFDCNVLEADGNFFKLYIKDCGANLDLNNVFTIISTLKPVN